MARCFGDVLFLCYLEHSIYLYTNPNCFGDVLLPDNTKAIPYFPCTLGKGSVIVRAWLTAILSQDSI